MTYNELAQVLETKNPKTGKLYTLADLNVFKMSPRRHGHARGRPLHDRQVAHDPDEPGDAGKFLEASFQGWIYCRDHPAACVTSC